MADVEIDTEHLISLVHGRPVIWDKTSETYKERNETRSAWQEICRELKNSFEVLESNNKTKFGKQVMKKWGNIRDTFQKSCKKIKIVKKSGAEAVTHKKYIDNKQLQFLKKVFEERQTEDSLTNTGLSEVSEAATFDTSFTDSNICKENTAANVTNPHVYKFSKTPIGRKHKFLGNKKNKTNLIDFLKSAVSEALALGSSGDQAESDADTVIIRSALAVFQPYDFMTVMAEAIDIIILLTALGREQFNIVCPNV
ncbi:uncharacterized protein [Diabrotica undecimpunctata]|uniref:uncharacterized protein n=1 Tax=Diabrotica undecimpunctata TaxID=50387 RepID=UPI003B63DEDC